MSDHDTDTPMTDDQFLDRLAAADPVEPADLPGAESPEAVALLDDILTADAAPSADRPRPEPVTALHGSGPVRGQSSLGGLVTRGRGALLAVAAAVLLLVGAVAVLAPDNTPAAVAEVRAAAAAADTGTGRVVSTFELSYDDSETQDAASGTVEVRYADRDIALSVAFDEVPGEFGDEVDEYLPTIGDVRLVDDVAYIQEGEGQWLAIDHGGFLGDLVEDFIDPRSVLATIQGLTETTEIGPAEVDGVTTTHFRSVIDLGDESLAQAGWLAFEGMQADVAGEVTVDLYVEDGGDGDGVLRRFDLSGDLEAPEGEEGSATFEVSTLFTDLGSDITIEAPEDAQVFDPLADAFGQDEVEVEVPEEDE